MSLNEYGPESVVLIVNGRQYTDFGDTDPAVSYELNSDLVNKKKGFGGGASKSTVINPGLTMTVNLMPGSPDTAHASTLMNTGQDIEVELAIISGGELLEASDGFVKNIGTTGRVGTVPTDDSWLFDFNVFTLTKGV